MSELLEFEDDILEDEEHEMGSLNHSLTQSQIIVLLSANKQFKIIPELTLDASQIDLTQFSIKPKKELIPDICVYPNTIKRKRHDILRMIEMPLLVIEIVSPAQSIEEILFKFDAYFALGIKSCWLIVPANEAVTVYSQPDKFKTFGTNDTEIIDEITDIRLSNRAIFAD